jgi:hypothetical protein
MGSQDQAHAEFEQMLAEASPALRRAIERQKGPIGPGGFNNFIDADL